MTARDMVCIATVLMMAFGSLVLPPAAAGPRGPVVNTDSEPNDDFANATEVIPGAGNTIMIQGTASQGDQEDYYKILLNRSGASSEKLNVATDVPENSAAPRLFIYDPNARFMVLDADANAGYNHTVETVAAATGYYFVWYELQVFDANPVLYNITFTKTSVSGVAIANGTTASAIPVDYAPVTFNGALDDPRDQADFYNMTLRSDAAAADVVTLYGIPSAALSIMVEVYFPNLTYIDPNSHYSPVQNLQPPAGQAQMVSFSASVPGNYYFRLLAVYGVGTYSLRVMKTPVARDSWNSAETAYGLQDLVNHHYYDFTDTLGKDVDNEDYFSFPASQGQIVKVTLYSTDYNKTLDLPQMTIELRDSNNVPYPDANYSGIAKSVCYANGVSPETTSASLLRVSLNSYYGGAGSYLVNISLDMPPTIYEGAWETGFIVNESSYGLLNLSTVFYDTDGDTLTYTAVNNVIGGKTMCAAIPQGSDIANFTTNQPGWTGMENWTFTATDPAPFNCATQANIHVTVQAVNHAPYVKNWNIPDISAYPGDVLDKTLNLTRYFADDDKDNIALDDYLTYHQENAEPLIITFQLIPGQPRQSGGVTVQIPDMPDLTSPLTITVLFWAIDAYNLSTPVLTCNITVSARLNKPPRWSANFTELSMNESRPGKPTEVVLNLADYCTDTDPWDKNNLTFMARNYNTSAFNVTLAGGVLRISPKPGFYTMPPHEQMTFNVTDTRGASAETTVTLVVRHIYTPPNVTGSSPAGSIEMDENQTMTFTVNVSLDAQLASLTPPPIRYRWFVNGTLQGNATTSFVFTTDFTSAARSPYNITFTVNDSLNEASRSWKVTVKNVNQPPVNVKITSPTKVNFTAGSTIEFTAAAAIDPDDPGAVLTYQWKDNDGSLGSGQTFKTGKLTAGMHRIVLIVTDPDGATAEDSITLKIKAAPPKPFLPGMEGIMLVAAICAAMALAYLYRKR